jgi:hypothetical protein
MPSMPGSRLDTAKEVMCALDMSTETFKIENQKERRLKRMGQNTQEL